MHDRIATLTTWKKFIAGQEIAPDEVSDYVLKSWKTCRLQGVDPEASPPVEVLTGKALERVLKNNAALIDAARPILNMAAISKRSTNSIALLYSVEGVLLAVEGDESALSLGERALNRPGCLCSPEKMGGRAITLSLQEGHPLSLCGAEHYCKEFHPTSCYAAPIYSEKGDTVGSIGISGWTPEWHPHTLALVTSAAEAISTRLREAALAKNQHRLNSMLISVYNSLPEAILGLDTQGRITHANSNAAALLTMEAQGLLGLRVGSLLHDGCKEEVLDLITQGKVSSCDIRFADSLDTTLHHCRIQPTLVSSGKPVGMTLSITTHKQLVDMTQKLGGNCAIHDFHHIKGDSQELKKCMALARKVAASHSRVLITGESGTGKELFAQAIHNNSPVRKGPFVAISCAAIPNQLMEAEFFGYVGGAFTGARRQGATGKFEIASGGTLFLDEINSLPLDMQAKLLRAIQQGEIVRVGDTAPTPVHVRIIAATNRDLMHAVRDKSFREDLYYRLNVVELKLPPLRLRPSDIPILARHIIDTINKDTKCQPSEITDEFLSALTSYSWPGNVRELYNACERALVMADGEALCAVHISDRIECPTGSPKGMPIIPLEESIKVHIKQAIAFHNGNMTKVAASLGMPRSTLYRKLERYKIK
ncbi:sigma 54-interacting transcriptional regulator [Desulfoluna sp.]|uniref:sigma-54-dependent Fis family transcriptional regulator n=1 Tax=Desulfoluna sp. TaxID=2045199 RepID=UPI00263375E4|nr:sigma 54-interacting transcriptional regulator [Desulfoluna sp.]